MVMLLSPTHMKRQGVPKRRSVQTWDAVLEVGSVHGPMPAVSVGVEQIVGDAAPDVDLDGVAGARTTYCIIAGMCRSVDITTPAEVINVWRAAGIPSGAKTIG